MASRQTRSQSVKQADEMSQSKMLTDNEMQSYFDSKFDKLFQDMATKSCVDKVLQVIETQKKQIEELQSKISVMDSLITQLRNNVDDQEQYQRRLCLRISGIPTPKAGESESREDCLEKVKSQFKDQLELDILDTVIDRAHRIGKARVVDGKRYRQVIVRFTTWRHRTQVYRARKKAQSHKINLDLTYYRSKAIQSANSLLKPKGSSYYAFADVNCRMCAKLGK